MRKSELEAYRAKQARWAELPLRAVATGTVPGREGGMRRTFLRMHADQVAQEREVALASRERDRLPKRLI